MELPEDVLALVREFSRPRFKYFKEYNHALKVMGRNSWGILKEKLYTDAEYVLPALHLYLEAFVKKKKIFALQDLRKTYRSDSVRFSLKTDLHMEAFYATRLEEDLFWLLIRILVGDGQSYWDFRLDTL
jgi:hypothetical protein